MVAEGEGELRRRIAGSRAGSKSPAGRPRWCGAYGGQGSPSTPASSNPLLMSWSRDSTSESSGVVVVVVVVVDAGAGYGSPPAIVVVLPPATSSREEEEETPASSRSRSSKAGHRVLRDGKGGAALPVVVVGV